MQIDPDTDESVLDREPWVCAESPLCLWTTLHLFLEHVQDDGEPFHLGG